MKSKSPIVLKQIIVEIDGKLCGVVITEEMRLMLPALIGSLSKDQTMSVVDLSAYGVAEIDLKGRNNG